MLLNFKLGIKILGFDWSAKPLEFYSFIVLLTSASWFVFFLTVVICFPFTSNQPTSSNLCDCPMASLCQSQQRCVKASIVSSWRLAEAQDQLCSLGVHSSESLEQERARTQACPTELTHNEEEWRRKESLLGVQEPSRSPVFGASWDVFDKASLPNNIAKWTYREAVFCAKILRPCFLSVSEYHQCPASGCRNGPGQV